MNPILLAGYGIAAMFLLIFMHVPIGVAMATVGTLGVGFLVTFNAGFSVLASEVVSTLGNQDLAVGPLFILMGNFAAASGISEEMYNLAYAFVGHRRGGLAMATIGGCGLFGSVCGSSFATTSTFGRVALPEMIKRGYSPELATGCVGGGGTLGALVPPSIVLVIYAVLAEQFIVELFIAAIVPAILTIVLYWTAIWIYVRIYPNSGPAGSRMSWSERLRTIGQSWSALVLMVLIGGGIYGGVFTVTEAAALGAILSILFTIIRGKMTWEVFWEALRGTAGTSGMIYVIISGAMVFNYFVVLTHMPDFIVSAIANTGWPDPVILTVLLVSYLCLGCVFDATPAMIITLPFVLPIITNMGYSPVWWGVVNVVITEIGLITPPIGINVFVLHGVAEEYPLKTVFKGILPFLFADFGRITLLAAFPIITLWLPSLFSG